MSDDQVTLSHAAHEAHIKRFEEAWLTRGPTRLEEFLPPDVEGRTRLLHELIHVDLEFRLRRGEAARVEDYLERFPHLDKDPPALLDLIEAEFALRRYFQVGAWPEEYFLRFPQFLQALPERLRPDAVTAVRRFQSPARPFEVSLPQPEVPGYEIEGELGRGGMGIVYKARHLALRRMVALKMIRLGYAASPQDLARFRREAEAIAHLDHTHVVDVYEISELRGWPYFSMRLLAGGSLRDALIKKRWPAPGSSRFEAAAKLVAQVARAVHHAHERGILHRDLKPSNVLLDETHQPAVADFGLAKRLESLAHESHGSTLIGTPAYVAPEQAKSGSAATTATDVYGLGAILYELLTLKPPFQADSVLATLLLVAEQPPEPPSQIDPTVPLDLETIALKCLEKQPCERYASALAVAEDLERWLAGMPIQARPLSRTELAWRWARRHPLLAGLSGALAASLVALLVTLAVSNVRIREREGVTAAALQSERKTLATLQQTQDRDERSRYLENVPLAHRLWQSNQTKVARQLLDQCAPGLRNWEWEYLRGMDSACVATLGAHADQANAVAYSPDGRWLATGDQMGGVRVFDATTNKLLSVMPGSRAAILDLAFSPDGKLLATAQTRFVKCYDTSTWNEVRQVEGGQWVRFSPDGRTMATSLGATIALYDVGPNALMRRLTGVPAPATCALFFKDGALMTGHVDGLRTWNLADGTFAPGPTWSKGQSFLGLQATSDGQRVLFTLPGRLVVTDATLNRQVTVAGPDILQTACTAMSRDGKWLAIGTTNFAIEVRSLDGTVPTRWLRGHDYSLRCMAFHPSGERLASSGSDETVRVWDLRGGYEYQLLPSFELKDSGSCRFSPDGKSLAFACVRVDARRESGIGVIVLDRLTKREKFRLPGANAIAWAPDGSWFAAGSESGEVFIYAAEDGALLRTLRGHQGLTTVIAVAPDGASLLTTGGDFTVRNWDPHSGKELLQKQLATDWVNCVSVSPDGKSFTAIQTHHAVEIWDVATLTKRHVVEPPHRPRCLSWSTDGKSIVSGSAERTIMIWDSQTGEVRQSLTGHASVVWCVAMSADGTRLVSCGTDKSVRVWDVHSGRELLSLPGVKEPVYHVAISPDGKQIVAAAGDLLLWEPEEPNATPP